MDGSEVTVRLALHPLDIAQLLLIAVIYCVFLLVILVSAGVAIANGVHLTLRDTSFVLATFVGFPLAVVAIYLSLRFSARKDGPFMLRTFKQILNASEASGEPSPVEVPTVH